MTKTELRKIYREKRNVLSETEKIKLDDLLLIQLQTQSLPFIATLVSYQPIEDRREPNTHLFSEYIRFRNPGLRLAYPKTDLATHTMTAIATDDSTLFQKNSLHIYEPDAGEIVPVVEADMVFVPLLAFDRQGYRVGYGKGFYDRFLRDCRTDCIKIGFAYFDPVNEIGGKDEFDVPLSLCITPQAAYVF